MFELVRVSRRYGETSALEEVDLTIARGRTTVLIGPSGCGKSTLLRVRIGLVEPDRGSVRLDGQSVNAASAPTLRRKMGYVIQDGGLFPHLTARGNVTLMARQCGWDGGRIEARLRELTDLTHFPVTGLDRYPAELSGGQRQRVALMRALILDPEVLLLDEPLGSLDPMMRSGLQDELRAIFRTLQKTVVFVTHDLAEAGFLGDTLVLMRGGGVVQVGSYREFLDSPADSFTRAFVLAQRRSPGDGEEAP